MVCFVRRFSSSTALAAKRVPVFSSSKFAELHLPPSFHVECPERVGEALAHLATSAHAEMKTVSAVDDKEKYNFALDIIKKVHDEEHVDEVAMACERGLRQLSVWDSDTYISRNSFDCFVLAQSAWLDAIDASISEGGPAFSLSRPPGHHALKSRSCGFCVFNFAVGAAEYALDMKQEINKVSILDWDVHFGNGVSDLVKNDGRIRYASTHQMDIFPGGLSQGENWKGPTENLLNVGIGAGSGKEPYLDALKSTILPFLLDDEGHKPDLLIICAGYDALASDPMANVSLKPEDFYDIASIIKEAAAAKEKKIHVCLGLEGGYNLQELPIAIEETLRAFSS